MIERYALGRIENEDAAGRQLVSTAACGDIADRVACLDASDRASLNGNQIPDRLTSLSPVYCPSRCSLTTASC